MAEIRSRYGDAALRTLRDLTRIESDMVLSTGWEALDRALGTGGLPRGRITEVIAQGSAGQGALVANVLCEAQRRRLTAAYVDVEGALDLETLAGRGVDLERLVVLRPDGWMHGLEMTRDLLAAGGVSVAILDRVPMWRADGRDTQTLEVLLREVVSLLTRPRCLALVLSEVAGERMYPQGLALRYFASVRLALTWQRWIVEDCAIVGFETRAEVIKNKLAAPGKTVQIGVRLPRGDGRCEWDAYGYR